MRIPFVLLGSVYCQLQILPPIIFGNRTTLAPGTSAPPATTVTMTTEPTTRTVETTGMTTTTEVVQSTITVGPTATNTFRPNAPEQKESQTGLSDSAKAGIVIAAVVLIAAAVGIYAFRTFGLQVFHD